MRDTILSQDFVSLFEKIQFQTSRLLNQSLIKLCSLENGALNGKILLYSSRLFSHNTLLPIDAVISN